MSKKKKLLRFADTKVFKNVSEPAMVDFFDKKSGEPFKHKLAGNWRKNIFKNDNPIVLELGCGKGEYSLGMAKAFPNKNFIGVDQKRHSIKGWKMCIFSELELILSLPFLKKMK